MANGPGRGWHGDSAGHAAAGRIGGQKSGGNLRKIELKQVEQEAIAVAILPKTANAHKKLAALADKTHPGQL